MTEEQYTQRRAVIIGRIYLHSKTFSNGSPKFPRCLAADKKELEKLDREYELQNQ